MEPVIPGPGGLITTDQAAALSGVQPVTVRNWILRGYTGPDGERHHLETAGRYKGRILLDPVAVAKAELATRDRARRITYRAAA
jgi:hypothetical protein